MNRLMILHANELVTCSGFAPKKGKEMMDLQIIPDGAVYVEDGVIRAVGTTEELLQKYSPEDCDKVIDATGKAVMPGFVDSHTHLVFGGYRAEEFNWRLSGVTYMEIMERGGGINNSIAPTRTATKEELTAVALKRLQSMLSFGVTTIEGKSGYGMDHDTEIKQLEVMKDLEGLQPIEIARTYLGAHSVLKEWKGKEDAFIETLIQNSLPVIKEKGLAEFVDIFVEKNVFSIADGRKLLKTAKEMGFGVKIHADEIVCLGGAELAAEVGAVSADHLLQSSDKGIEEMAKKGVVATVLPCTAFNLKEEYAPARKMIDKGCAVAIATDFNPGSCFCENLSLAFLLATLYMDVRVEEAVTAITINGAAAIGRETTIGSIDVGKQGDMVILEFPSYKYIPYHLSVSAVETVIKKGEVVFNRFQ